MSLKLQGHVHCKDEMVILTVFLSTRNFIITAVLGAVLWPHEVVIIDCVVARKEVWTRLQMCNSFVESSVVTTSTGISDGG